MTTSPSPVIAGRRGRHAQAYAPAGDAAREATARPYIGRRRISRKQARNLLADSIRARHAEHAMFLRWQATGDPADYLAWSQLAQADTAWLAARFAKSAEA